MEDCLKKRGDRISRLGVWLQRLKVIEMFKKNPSGALIIMEFEE